MLLRQFNHRFEKRFFDPALRYQSCSAERSLSPHSLLDRRCNSTRTQGTEHRTA